MPMYCERLEPEALDLLVASAGTSDRYSDECSLVSVG